MPTFSVKLTSGQLLQFGPSRAFRPVPPEQASRFTARKEAICAAFNSGLTAKQFVLVPTPEANSGPVEVSELVLIPPPRC